jgi:hypothetical protein
MSSVVSEVVIMQLIPLIIIGLVIYMAVRKGGRGTKSSVNKNTNAADFAGGYGPIQRERNMMECRSAKIIMAIFWIIVFLVIPAETVLALKASKDITQILTVVIFSLLPFWWVCFLGLRQIKERISQVPENIPGLFKMSALAGILIALFLGPIILFSFGAQRIISKMWHAITLSGNRTRVRAARIRTAQIDWPSVSGVPLLSIRSRISHWLTLIKTMPIHEDAIKKAGEEGERKVLALMDGHRGLNDAHLYAGRRVPKTKDHPLIPSRRSEIDLVVLTPKAVHVIEVKNWSGEIWQSDENPDQWIRRRRNRDPETIRNVADVNRAKAWSLCNYLESRGVAVGADHIRSHVFFTNPNLKMDLDIAEMSDVVTVQHISGFLSGLGTNTLDRIILRMAKLVLDKESADMVHQGLAGAMPQSIYDRMLQELDQLHTWDRLYLHGGAIETGDLVWVKSHGLVLKSDELQPGEQIRIQWQRGRILSLVRAIMGDHLGHIITANQKVAADMQGQVFFHFAGQPEPVIVPVTSVNIIERG